MVGEVGGTCAVGICWELFAGSPVMGTPKGCVRGPMSCEAVRPWPLRSCAAACPGLETFGDLPGFSSHLEAVKALEGLEGGAPGTSFRCWSGQGWL